LIESPEVEHARLYEVLSDAHFYLQNRSRILAAKVRIEELDKEITTGYQ
jgi:hypothetical protein